MIRRCYSCSAEPAAYRFDRKGNVVLERRRLSALFNTDAYMRGDLIFAPRRSSPASSHP